MFIKNILCKFGFIYGESISMYSRKYLQIFVDLKKKRIPRFILAQIRNTNFVHFFKISSV